MSYPALAAWQGSGIHPTPEMVSALASKELPLLPVALLLHAPYRVVLLALVGLLALLPLEEAHHES